MRRRPLSRKKSKLKKNYIFTKPYSLVSNDGQFQIKNTRNIIESATLTNRNFYRALPISAYVNNFGL